jgi:two-component system response regulator MprA
MPGPRLILLEDDRDLREILARGLREEGFEVRVAGRGVKAVELALISPPDGLVIDIGLPDADGRDVCMALRAEGIDVPVLFLTARDAVSDRISGFSAGGDDYVTKPFAFEEVVVRLRALLRRSGGVGAQTVAGLKLDPATHALSVAEKSVPLTPTEFRILAALATKPGTAVRRRDLIAAAWPTGAIVHDNTLDVYVGRLRRKLRELPESAQIHTVHGVGYRLE